MSEDRINKDPLLGGLDGMRARQTWEGAPEKMNAGGDGQAASETEPVPEDSAQAPEAFSAEEVQTAEEEARRIAQELHREAVKTGNTEKEIEVPRTESSERRKKKAHEEDEKEKKQGGLGKEIFEWVKIIVSAALIAFVLNTFIIANSEVPSGSMENTIMTGDRVIGSRLSYRFEDPKRGDIAIFRFPDNEKIYYVKRIIGLPGETVDIVDGKVYINGSDEPLDEPYIREPMIPEAPMHFEVPENSYFMMGDNRHNSADSRFWGFVPEDHVVGKPVFIGWSADKDKSFPGKIRWNRIFSHPE